MPQPLRNHDLRLVPRALHSDAELMLLLQLDMFWEFSRTVKLEMKEDLPGVWREAKMRGVPNELIEKFRTAMHLAMKFPRGSSPQRNLEAVRIEFAQFLESPNSKKP